MTRPAVLIRLGVLVLGLLAVLAAGIPATAGEGRVPLPQLATPKGETCVEPKDFMRRNHMELLKHRRDETMREGIRTKDYSWEGCVNCHADTHPDIAGGKVATLYPFCAQCHHYAAVEIDCIQCHTTTPDSGKKTAARGGEAEADELLSMLKGHLKEADSQ